MSNLQNIDDTVRQIFTAVSKEVLEGQKIEMIGILTVGLSELGCNETQIAYILKLAEDNPNDIEKLKIYLKENSNIKKSTTTTNNKKNISVIHKSTYVQTAVDETTVQKNSLPSRGGQLFTPECQEFFEQFKADCQKILDFIDKYIIHGFSKLYSLVKEKVIEYYKSTTTITFADVYKYVTTSITSLKDQVKNMFKNGLDKIRSLCTSAKCGVLQIFLAFTVVPVCIAFLGFIQFICVSYITYMQSTGAFGVVVSYPPAVLTGVTLPVIIPLLESSQYLLNSHGCKSDMIDNICDLLNYILETLLSIAILNKNCSKYLYNIIECTSQLLIDKVNGVKAKDKGVSGNEAVDATSNDNYNTSMANEVKEENNKIESDKNEESEKVVKYKHGVKSGCNREINPKLKELFFTLVEDAGNIIMIGLSTLHIIDLAYALVNRLTEKIKKQSKLVFSIRIITNPTTGGILHKKVYKKKRYTKQKKTKKHRIRKSKKIKNKNKKFVLSI